MRRIQNVAVAAAVFCLGCQTADYVAPPSLAPEELPLTLALEQHRVVMSTVAPYNTVQLSAVLLNAEGEPLPDAVVTFVSTDSVLRVTQGGLLTARAITEKAGVKVSGRYRGILLSDTVFVRITDEASPRHPRTFSIQPVPGDSAKFAASDVVQSKEINPITRDASGTVIPDVDAYLWSTNPRVASDEGRSTNHYRLTPRLPGTVMVHASATYYGVSLVDSVLYTIAPPLFAEVDFAERLLVDGTRVASFSINTVTLSAGGVIGWFIMDLDRQLDVIFDDPSAATAGCHTLFGCGGELPATGGTGNISAYVANDTIIFGNARFRRFNRPGTYTYHSTKTTDTGVIVVQ